MDAPKPCKVSIFGEIYSLVSDQSEQHLIEAARRLDVLMKEVSEASGIQDAKKVAVLVALRLSSNSLVTETNARHDAEQIQKLFHLIDRTLTPC